MMVGTLMMTFCSALTGPSAMKQVFSIWSNNIEIDEEGKVLNEDYALFRGGQYLRVAFDPNFHYHEVVPPFEPCEHVD